MLCEEAQLRKMDKICNLLQLNKDVEMDMLDIGCGWGSLTLWLCERYPHARVVAFSNSTGQAAFIRDRARERGFGNLQVVTADIHRIASAVEGRFDRIALRGDGRTQGHPR